MAYPGAMDLDAAGNDPDFAAAIDGDSTARWRALEACRDYLRLVIERGRWAKNGASLRASDLVQKTIVDGWDNFSAFHGHTPHQLRAWLTSILIHSSLNARRRPYEVPIESGGRVENVADSASSPSKAVRKSDARGALESVLAGLPARYRDVIHFRLWDQRSFAQIGERLSVTEDGARMLYGRAIARLRESMRPGNDSSR